MKYARTSEKGQRHITDDDDKSRVADFWTPVALDANAKLVPVCRVGKRTAAHACASMHDLSDRLANRVQILSVGLAVYVDVVESAFGASVDCGSVVKSYEAEPIGPGRYSPPKVIDIERTRIAGNPEEERISTSHVERQNLTMHINTRRFTRLTDAFSKKVENLKAAVALHFAHYNLVRVDRSLRVTLAMPLEFRQSYGAWKICLTLRSTRQIRTLPLTVTAPGWVHTGP